jgi:MFS family permease
MVMGTQSWGSFPRIAVVVAVLAFLSDFCNNATSPTVSILAVNLGASYAYIGTMAAASSLTGLIFTQPVGILSDRLDKRIFLLTGFTCYIIYFLLLIIARSPAEILFGKIAYGLGAALFYTTAMALVLTERGINMGTSVGLYATLMGAGFSLGPLVGGFVAERVSYSASYTLSIAFAAAALPLAWWGIKGDEAAPSRKKDVRTLNMLELARNRELLLACVGGFFAAEAIGVDMNFFPVYGKGILISVGVIGTILALRAALSTVVRLPVGSLTKRFGVRRIMAVSLSLCALGLFMVPFFDNVWLLILSLGLEGIGYGMFLTASNTYIGEIVPEGSRGSAVGFYYTFSNIGGVVNMTVIGLIASVVGISNTFRYTSATIVLGLVIMFVLKRKGSP